MKKIVDKIISWWIINDLLPQEVDVIVEISYGAENTKLTTGSSFISYATKDIGKAHPNAVILWGTFSKNPKPGVELKCKNLLFEGLKSIHAGEVSSTTDECEAIKKIIIEKSIPAKNIIVVVEGSHSRRVKKVWDYFLPNSHIYFKSIDPRIAADRNNPMILQRYWWLWFMVNLLLYPLYLGNGVKRMAKLNFSQPSL